MNIPSHLRTEQFYEMLAENEIYEFHLQLLQVNQVQTLDCGRCWTVFVKKNDCDYHL